MSDWTALTLGDAIRIKHGFAFPGAGFGVDPSTPQVFTPGNFALGGGFQAAKPKSFVGEYPPEFLLSSGEVVITMTDLSKAGDTLGFAAQLPYGQAFLHNQRIGLVEILDESRIDARFFNYLTRTVGYRSHILGTASGSTVKHTSPRRIGDYRAVVPPIAEQQAIAEVLGALDDKIAANTALAVTAEQVLRAEIDAAWLRGEDRSSTLADYLELNPKVAIPRTETAIYVDMKRLPESGWSIDGFDHREPKGGARFQNGDTLLARITPCLENRKTGFVDHLSSGEIGVGSTEFIVLRSRDGIAAPISFLLATAARFREHAIQHMIGTSGRQRVAASDLASFELPTPDLDWLAKFSEHAKALFAAVAAHSAENRTLAATRDALLPQLMSGKLRVRDAEAMASEAGA